jgi:hypothetical protein
MKQLVVQIALYDGVSQGTIFLKTRHTGSRFWQSDFIVFWDEKCYNVASPSES